MSPTQRTLAWFKKHDIPAGVVERWIAPARRRIDLFGIADVVAIYPDAIVAVQITSGSNHASHRKKILENDKTPLWLKHGRIELWSWSKRKSGKRHLWTPRVEQICSDFQTVRIVPDERMDKKVGEGAE